MKLPARLISSPWMVTIIGLILIAVLGWASYSLYGEIHPLSVFPGPVPGNLTNEGTGSCHYIDFRYYHGVGKMILAGKRDIYRRDGALGFGVEKWSATYPPTAYYLLSPLSLEPMRTAAGLWHWLKLLSLFLTGWLMSVVLFSDVRQRLPGAILFFFAVLSFWPAIDDFKYGNVNLIVLALFVLSLYLLNRDREIPAGVVLGIIFCLKFLSAPIILYYLLRRRWRVVLPAAAVIILVSVLAAAMLGPGAFVDYFNTFGHRMVETRTILDNSSSASLLARMKIGGWVHYLWVFLVLAGEILFLLKIPRPGNALIFSALICTGLLISPLLLPYHQVLLLLPLGYLMAARTGQTGRRSWWYVWGAAIVFLILALLAGADISAHKSAVFVGGKMILRGFDGPLVPIRRLFLRWHGPLLSVLFVNLMVVLRGLHSGECEE